MPMRVIALLLFCALVIFFTGCKKDSPTVTYYKIKSMSSNGIITNYTYDDEGRVVSARNSNGSGDVYIYGSGKVVDMYYDSTSPNNNDVEIYFLNDNGLVSV